MECYTRAMLNTYKTGPNSQGGTSNAALKSPLGLNHSTRGNQTVDFLRGKPRRFENT